MTLTIPSSIFLYDLAALSSCLIYAHESRGRCDRTTQREFPPPIRKCKGYINLTYKTLSCISEHILRHVHFRNTSDKRLPTSLIIISLKKKYWNKRKALSLFTHTHIWILTTLGQLIKILVLRHTRHTHTHTHTKPVVCFSSRSVWHLGRNPC